ncbi:hypothetical protein TrCOL_g7332 [Triparma columacea]|uniref:J domain-containing protein n=1 Tax=Triparma columacea TaxID=722753 RepID=A0A9W7FY95_9STRA|nr:hypothetical protein TrCOL_g7332 [Triparma columacea]
MRGYVFFVVAATIAAKTCSSQLLSHVIYTLFIDGYDNPIRVMHGQEVYDSVTAFAEWNGMVDEDIEEIMDYICNDEEAPRCNRRWKRKKVDEFWVSGYGRGRGRGHLIEFFEDSDINAVGLQACKLIPGCMPAPDPRVGGEGGLVTDRVVSASELELREELRAKMEEYERSQVKDPNLYVRLGLGERRWKASAKEISSAFRERSLRWHPDRDGGDHEMFLLVQEAYDTLGDEEMRGLYDGKVAGGEGEGGGDFMEGGEGIWDGKDGRPLVQGDRSMFSEVSVDEAGNVRIVI